MIKQENDKQPIGNVTIKTEPGTSTAPVMERLQSLRAPRDLALSQFSNSNKIPNLSNMNPSKMKKVYIPNYNVQRNKAVENAQVKPETSKPNLPEQNGRGKGKKTRNTIQLNQGLFAEGIPGQRSSGRGRFSGGSDNKADTSLKRPTLKLKENFKVDKKEEEDTMKQLLQDDFVDDPTLEPDFENCPITLPFLNCKEDPGLKKKSDIKPVVKKEYVTVNDVLSEDTPTNPGFIYLQLPSSMPGVTEDEVKPQVHPATSTSTSTAPPPEKQEVKERCLLNTLPGGQIGKLQILKSGRARFIFGDTKMWLDMGTPLAFKQDVMSVKLNKDSHTGDMVNLGQVNVRMVATPDWEGILGDLKNQSISQPTSK